MKWTKKTRLCWNPFGEHRGLNYSLYASKVDLLFRRELSSNCILTMHQRPWRIECRGILEYPMGPLQHGSIIFYHFIISESIVVMDFLFYKSKHWRPCQQGKCLVLYWAALYHVYVTYMQYMMSYFNLHDIYIELVLISKHWSLKLKDIA